MKDCNKNIKEALQESVDNTNKELKKRKIIQWSLGVATTILTVAAVIILATSKRSRPEDSE